HPETEPDETPPHPADWAKEKDSLYNNVFHIASGTRYGFFCKQNRFFSHPILLLLSEIFSQLPSDIFPVSDISCNCLYLIASFSKDSLILSPIPLGILHIHPGILDVFYRFLW